MHSQCCLPLVEDEEELASAVQFLHCQSMLIFLITYILNALFLTHIHLDELIHFKDALLKEFYFLDIQWIFSTITNIMKMLNTNGNFTIMEKAVCVKC